MISSKLANRYEILGELGRGGMGVVYRARDPRLNREVAVKLLPAKDLTPDLEERFQREAQVVAQMDHPAIVPIYDLGRTAGGVYLWKNRADAEAFYNAGFRDFIRAHYRAEPTITLFDTPIVVDNLADKIISDRPGSSSSSNGAAKEAVAAAGRR